MTEYLGFKIWQGQEVFLFPKASRRALGGHLGIKQPECEAVGTYPFGAYFMDVFKHCVLAPYTLWWCSIRHRHSCSICPFVCPRCLTMRTCSQREVLPGTYLAVSCVMSYLFFSLCHVVQGDFFENHERSVSSFI